MFDRNKSAIYAIYSRALRDNPTLQAFVDFYLSDAGIASVTDADYVAIPALSRDAAPVAQPA